MGGRASPSRSSEPGAGRRAAAVALALALGAGPAAATGVLSPDWPSPSRAAPIDPWSTGNAALDGYEVLVRAGWKPLEIVLEEERPWAALRERAGPRLETGRRSPFERLANPQRPPLAIETFDEIRLSARARATAGRARPSPLRRAASAPPAPWEITSPSHLHELLQVAPPAFRAESRLGMTDVIATGMTVAVAPGETAPNWAEDIWAESDPLTRGLALAQPGPRPRQPESPAFVRLMVIGALGFGTLALIGIVHAVMRESDGPKKLRSKRFG